VDPQIRVLEVGSDVLKEDAQFTNVVCYTPVLKKTHMLLNILVN